MIIDAHTHIFPDKIAEKATTAIGAFYDIPMHSTAASDKLLAAEQAAGIDQMLVCSSATTPAQVESINTFIAAECAKHPQFIGFAAMHPEYENVGEELDRAVELGLQGVKFHPDFQRFNIDEEAFLPMYREIAKRNLPILFHTGDKRYDFSSPFRVDNLLKRVPDLKVIGAHFGGYGRWMDVMSLPRRENVWFDTSSSLFELPTEDALRLIDHFGVDRFFFGTDFPMWNPTEELERFYALGLSDGDNEKIFHENFEAMLNA